MKLFIKTLSLKNFKCIKHCELDFTGDSSLNFIQGENGYGKSTVLEALALCLDDYKKGNTYNSFVSWDAKTGESAEIDLICSIDSEDLRIQISIPITGSLVRTAEYKGDIKKGTEVISLLEKLGIKDFSSIMFYLQGTPDITNTTPAELSASLQKLFSYDLDQYLELLDTANLDSRALTIERDLGVRKNATFKKMEFKEFNETEEEFNSIKANIKQWKEEAEELEKVKKEVEDLKTSKADRNMRLLNLNKLRSGLDEKLKYLEIYEAKLKDYKEQETQNEAKFYELKEALNNAKDAKTKKLETLDHYSKLDHDVSQYQKSIEYKELINKLQEEIDTNQPKIEQITVELNDITDSIKVLEASAKGVCPICGQSTNALCDLSIYSHLKSYTALGLEKLKELKTVKNEELKRAQSIVYQNSTSIDSAKEVYEDLKWSVEDIETLDPRVVADNLEQATDDYNESTSICYKAESDLDSWKSIIVNLRAPEAPNYDSDSIKKQTEEYNQTETTIKTELDVIDKSLETLPTIEKIQEEISYRNTSGLENMVKEREVIEAYNNEAKRINDEADKASEENASTILELEKEYAQVKTDLKNYAEAKTLIGKELPSYITVKTCKKLELEINGFLQVVFPELTVEMKQQGKGVSFSYGQTNSDKRSSIKLASGFEKQLLSIAWKVALSKAYGINVLFLDEADSFSSQSNSYKLYQQLFCSGLFDQIFLISHNGRLLEDLKQDFKLNLYKVESKGIIEKLI